MARTTEKDRVKKWQSRVDSANRAYDEWEKEYRCKTLMNFYLGKQWEEQEVEFIKDEKYVINMVFPTMEIKIPSMLYYNPKPIVVPRPSKSMTPGTTLDAEVQLLEDVAATVIDDPRVHFKDHCYLSLKESFWRFGVIEVGYSADWNDNPNAGKPILEENEEAYDNPDDPTASTNVYRDSAGSPVPQPSRTIDAESFYVRRIPSHQFRTPTGSHNILEENDWVGYFEWVHITDIRKDKSYDRAARNKAKPRGMVAGKYEASPGKDPTTNELYGSGQNGMCKIWKIWSNREQRKFVWNDGAEEFLIDGEPMEFYPFSTLKFHEIPDQFLPLPPIYNWLKPQIELNETREMMRVHRKRFYRRYTYLEGAIEEAEIEKLERGGDGVYAKATLPQPLNLVPNGDMDRSVYMSVPQTKDDLLQITGVSSEARGEADANTTATQSTIVESRTRIRENFGREQVAEWVAKIIWLLLKTMQARMALPFLVKTVVDTEAPGAQEYIQAVGQVWKVISHRDLDTFDFDVKVDIDSMSPLNQDAKKKQWGETLALITNPALVVAMLSSDVILRKTLAFEDIRSPQEIAEIKKALTAMQMAMMAMAQAKAGAKGGTGAAGAASGAQGDTATPGPSDPANQPVMAALAAQMGGGGPVN